MFIIQNIPEQKYFVDIKHVTVTADSPDLSDSVTELAYSMLKSFTPQTCITKENENYSNELPYEYMLALHESDEATSWQPFVRPDPWLRWEYSCIYISVDIFVAKCRDLYVSNVK